MRLGGRDWRFVLIFIWVLLDLCCISILSLCVRFCLGLIASTPIHLCLTLGLTFPSQTTAQAWVSDRSTVDSIWKEKSLATEIDPFYTT